MKKGKDDMYEKLKKNAKGAVESYADIKNMSREEIINDSRNTFNKVYKTYTNAGFITESQYDELMKYCDDYLKQLLG